jgi:hypothetical protein
MGHARRTSSSSGDSRKRRTGPAIFRVSVVLYRSVTWFLYAYRPAQITAPGFTPVGAMQGALAPMGSTDPSSSSSSQPNGTNGADLSVGPHTGGLPFTPTSILPARPNLPDDPVIPHNGFLTVEEGEKAFMHLLRKAGVDANWTWDQTMRAIITDPLYKALNTLAEKKAAWEKVSFVDVVRLCGTNDIYLVHHRSSSERTRRTRSEVIKVASCT